MDNVFAIDTERVQVSSGRDTLALVCISDWKCRIIYKEYVMPGREIIDYRTPVSGITPGVLEKYGRRFEDVKQEVLGIIRNSILVGHSIHHDLRALGIAFPEQDIRDTSNYWYFRQARPDGNTPGLLFLAQRFLNARIRRSGRHSCAEDAVTTMRLYRLVAEQWESELESSDEDEESYDEYEESYDEYEESYDEYEESYDESEESPVEYYYYY